MKVSKRIIAVIAAVLMLCGLFVGCEKTPVTSSVPTETTVPVEKGDKSLKLYVCGFQNLDPQIWSWGTHVDRMGIFEGLTILNPDFTVRMADAESLTHNDDFTVWTAKIRKDLKWSDGQPLNANDYMYSFERVIAPDMLKGKVSCFFGNVDIVNALECKAGKVGFDQVGIKKIDDYTIEFTLSIPCSDFDMRLTESWGLPVPKHVIDKLGDEWTKPENIVVNGPFIVTQRDENVHMALHPNPYYHDKPALERVDVYAGSQNQLLAYKNKDINVAMVTAADIDVVKNDPELSSHLHTFSTSVVSYIGLLKGKNDYLQRHPEIRKAISLSIDRKTLAEKVDKGTVTPANSFVYPGFADWADKMGVIEYNVDKAKDLMAKAGFPNGEGLPEMTYLCAGTPGADTLAIVDMIKRGTGIKIKIVNAEWAAFVKDRDSFHEDETWGIYADGWNTAVASAAGSFANYQFDLRTGNLEIEGLKAFAAANRNMVDEEAARKTCKTEEGKLYLQKYEEMIKTGDVARKTQLMQEMEKMRLEDSSNIPLWWNNTLVIIRPTIKGYIGNPLLLYSPPFYFKDITND